MGGAGGRVLLGEVGGSCTADSVSSACMTSVLSFCPEFGMGLDEADLNK